MKKLLAYIIIPLLLLSLCSCGEVNEAEPAEPQSVPELESIVESIMEDAASDDAELEPESKAAYPGKTETPVPVAIQEQSEPVRGDSPPPALVAPEEVSEPELQETMSSDFRLDSGIIEAELLRLINSLRDKEGVNALGIEDSMRFAARVRAAEAYESFSHTRPDKTPYNTAFDESGFSYTGKWHGENLSSISCPPESLTEKEIALKMFNELKSSPGHFRNMTEENFVQTGIGVAVTYTDGNVDVTSAQMFASL